MRLMLNAICLTITLVLSATAGAADPAVAAKAEEKAEALEHAVATQAAPAKPAPSETITATEAKAVDPQGAAPLDDTLTCLARTIYWESKGASSADMQAVANVVLNRVGHDGFPDTVCAVVKDGSERHACQFSWWCDGRADQIKEDDEYLQAKEVARQVLNRQLPDNSRGALYFHDRNVSPDWSKTFLRTAQTGKFVFYRPKNGAAR
ncbi:cell wall hydrolase [Pseudomonas huaxiensis]|uniref:cell wall hydrolase n=1 Tax=Pseudomonas huaxiensis TaxID=2213017 RepID=UPI000DA66342|nr:cell wall hydrolase [Pseudomonas huaxiensis]